MSHARKLDKNTVNKWDENIQNIVHDPKKLKHERKGRDTIRNIKVQCVLWTRGRKTTLRQTWRVWWFIYAIRFDIIGPFISISKVRSSGGC